MQSPFDQYIEFTPPNRFHDIYLVHVSGPMKGVEIRFSVAFARNAPVAVPCRCDAYAYPHRKGKGQCPGLEKTPSK